MAVTQKAHKQPFHKVSLAYHDLFNFNQDLPKQDALLFDLMSNFLDVHLSSFSAPQDWWAAVCRKFLKKLGLTAYKNAVVPKKRYSVQVIIHALVAIATAACGFPYQTAAGFFLSQVKASTNGGSVHQ
jgi:hypothetical protein